MLTTFVEQRSAPWPARPFLVAADSGRVLSDRPERLPMTFALTAVRPA